jgi:hypothetical protein
MSSFSSLCALLAALGFASMAAANEMPCSARAGGACEVNDRPPSWIFAQSTYTHDPFSGARVAQYMRKPPVEPLDDQRMVTSRYYRSRTNLRGAHGSFDTYYQVQHWGNGRGGIDAEWERFHDAWKESYLQGGFYNQGPGYGGVHPGFGLGGFWPGYGYGFPGNGFPGGGWGGGPAWGGGPGGHGGHGGGNGHGGKWEHGGEHGEDD